MGILPTKPQLGPFVFQLPFNSPPTTPSLPPGGPRCRLLSPLLNCSQWSADRSYRGRGGEFFHLEGRTLGKKNSKTGTLLPLSQQEFKIFVDRFIDVETIPGEGSPLLKLLHNLPGQG